jgi:hypothetical protein
MRELVINPYDLIGLTIEKATVIDDEMIMLLSENKFIIVCAMWDCSGVSDIEIANTCDNCSISLVTADVISLDEMRLARADRDEKRREIWNRRREWLEKARSKR